MESTSQTKFPVEATQKYINEQFDKSIIPALQEFIKVPNTSRLFDAEWNSNGLLEQAAQLLLEWVNKQNLKGSKAEIIQDAGKTPLLFIEVDGTTPDTETVLLYGHFDKQPWMTGWREGLGPITPVIEGDKLFGRGGADDGYSTFGSVIALKALQEQGLPHPRCIVFIEGDEESGSHDLPYYFEKMSPRIGTPSLLVCLDSGCGDYERLYLTTTLRGNFRCTIKVKILEEGVHSGDASGVVPDSFRILRIIMDRLEDSSNGQVHRDLFVNIPGDRYQQAQKVSEILGTDIQTKFPYVEGGHSVDADPFQSYLNRIWRPQIAYLGVDGMPATNKAGNVLRPETYLRISCRLPPTLEPKAAEETFRKLIESNPPYGAEVKMINVVAAKGFNAPENRPYLDNIIDQASQNFFGKGYVGFGEGGSIPFIDMLKAKYPSSQFVVTGVLGPHSNAHGPNESLDIPYTKKVVCCMTQILGEIYHHLKKTA